tara:strand:- start:945 stop:1175 length:231 start_codon:yes stop_codon:yes gene_type:complete
MTIKMSDGKVFYQKTCSITKKDYQVEVSFAQFVRVRTGKELIQHILSHLSPDDRELIITGKTPAEWDKMLKEPKTK